MRTLLEVCVDSLESALAAERGGADRIELFASLIEGGLTPSSGLLHCTCRQLKRCKIYVLIRPRGGDFLYSQAEVEVMKQDVITAAAAGAHGIVTGFLTREGNIDSSLTTQFVDLASALGLDFTFHRAFDVVKDQFEALSTLIECRVPRVLTSGGQPSALQGAEMIESLVSHSEGRISIMPGGGITEENVSIVVECTGVDEVHGSFRYSLTTKMKFIHPIVDFAPRSEEQQEEDRSLHGRVKNVEALWMRQAADEDAIARVMDILRRLAEKEMG